MVDTAEGLQPFHCRLLLGQNNQATGNSILACKILGFRLFKEVQFKLGIVRRALFPGNVLQMCMSAHALLIHQGKNADTESRW